MKRLAGKVDVCGLLFSVYIVDETECPDIVGCWGLCEVEKQIIYLHEDASAAVRRFYLSHEMLHAIWGLAGLRDSLTRAKDSEDGEHMEEIFVRLASPHILIAERSADRLDLS